MLGASVRKMFHLSMFAGMSQKLYKITVSKEDICKHAKSMLNVSGVFFIASGVS